MFKIFNAESVVVKGIAATSLKGSWLRIFHGQIKVSRIFYISKLYSNVNCRMQKVFLVHVL